MNPQAVPQQTDTDIGMETANDRFKRSFGSWFWGSINAAIVIHFLIFALWPTMQAEDFSYTNEEMEAIDLPPEIEIPPPPEQIARPAQPVIAEAEIDEDITIAPTTFESNPVDDLPPPPEGEETDLSAQPTFTPYTVAPRLTNEGEVQRALTREYPPLLRDAGIGGRVLVYFFIDETGRVIDTRIREGSGHAKLDEAALDVADVMQFTAAMNRDKKVPVWISLPITFQVR